MSKYKLCNAEQLDADLVAVAEAIRSKAGSGEKLLFPQDYITAIMAIQGGPKIATGTYTVANRVSGSNTTKIEHSAGFIPRIFIMYRNAGARPSTDYALSMFCKYITDPTNGRGAGCAIGSRTLSEKNDSGHVKISLNSNNSVFKDTATTCTIWGAYNNDSDLYLAPGDTYTYIAVSDWEGNF